MDNYSPILFDALVLTAVFISIIVSVARGFLRDMLSIVVWIGAIALGYFGSANLTPFLSNYMPHIAWFNWAVGGVITIIGLFIGSIINGYFVKLFKMASPSILDRSFGFLFGFVRGIFLVSLAFITIQAFLPKETPPYWFKESKLKFLLQNGGSVIIYLMPAQIDKNLGKMRALRLNNSSPKVFERLNLPSFMDQTDASTPGYTSGQRNKLDDKIRNLK
jgi:membrane protein required for colicin V production